MTKVEQIDEACQTMKKLWTTEMSELTGVHRLLSATSLPETVQASIISNIKITDAQKQWMESSFEGTPLNMTRLCRAILRVISPAIRFVNSDGRRNNILAGNISEATSHIFPKLFFPVLSKQKGLSFVYPSKTGETLFIRYGHKHQEFMTYVFIMALEWMSHQKDSFVSISTKKQGANVWGVDVQLYEQKLTPQEAADIRLKNFWKRHKLSEDFLTGTDETGVSIQSWMKNVSMLSFGLDSETSVIKDSLGDNFVSRVHLEPHFFSYQEGCDVSGAGRLLLNTSETGFVIQDVSFQATRVETVWHIVLSASWGDIIARFRADYKDFGVDSLYHKSMIYSILPYLHIGGEMEKQKRARVSIIEGKVVAPRKETSKKEETLVRAISAFVRNSGSVKRQLSYSIYTLVRETSSPEEARALKILRGLGLSGQTSLDVRALSLSPAIMQICETHPMLGALLLQFIKHDDNNDTFSRATYETSATFTKQLKELTGELSKNTLSVKDIFKKLNIPSNLQKMIFSKSPKIFKGKIFKAILRQRYSIDFRLFNEHLERIVFDNPKEKPTRVFSHVLNMSGIFMFLENARKEGIFSQEEYKLSRRYKILPHHLDVGEAEINDTLSSILDLVHLSPKFGINYNQGTIGYYNAILMLLIELGILRKTAFISDLYGLVDLYHKNNELISACAGRIKVYGIDAHDDRISMDTWKPLHKAWSCPSGTLEFITTSNGLEEESLALHHCVRSYSRSCFSYNSFIARIIGHDSTRSTLELQGALSDGSEFLEVLQNKSIHNTSPTGGAQEVFKKYLKSKEYKKAKEKFPEWKTQYDIQKKVIDAFDGKQTFEDWALGFQQEYPALVPILFKNRPDVTKVIETIKRLVYHKRN